MTVLRARKVLCQCDQGSHSYTRRTLSVEPVPARAVVRRARDVEVGPRNLALLVALGLRTTGVMGDEQLVEQVVSTAKAVGEPFWPMPIPSEMRALLNSDIADIANVKPGNTAGGMLVAASFLRDFVGSTGEGDDKRQIPWAHLDIAGPSYNNAGGYAFNAQGPTGVTVRTLIALAEDFSRA